MFNIGPPELIIILVIALIVFGPRRLPEMMRTFGKSVREFRRASEEITQDLRLDLDDRPSFPTPVSPPANQPSLEDAAAAPDRGSWQATGAAEAPPVAQADQVERARSAPGSPVEPSGEGPPQP